MPSYRPSIVDLRLKVVIVLALSFLIIGLASVFPSKSGAKVQLRPRSQAATKKQMPYVPGEVLVRYRSESLARRKTGVEIVASRAGEVVSARIERFDGADLVEGLRLAYVEPQDTLRAVAALRDQPDVLYAEPNYILHADITTPNDSHFTDPGMYGLNKIGAPLAWDTTKGSSSVVVGVIDQGIDINHLDLQANVWTNPMPGSVTGISGDLHGYNFVNNNGTVFSGADEESHATHVAGILGAVGNNSKGIVGVNWNVGLMSLKFLNEFGGGRTSDAIRACNYAKQMRDLWLSSSQTKGANVRVLNASFGGGGFTQSFLDSINQLNSSGILFVAAAGNVENGTREPNNDLVPHYPSSFNAPNVVSVAATTQSDGLAFFSHFGATTVDLGAPGFQILSTTPHCSVVDPDICEPDFTDANGDTYSYFSGTSMAAPQVSGAAALLWAQNPNLTVQQVKNLLLLNGDAVNGLNGTTLSGRRLNVAKSLQALAAADAVAPGAVSNLHINFQNGLLIDLGWTASGDDGATGQAALYELSFTDSSSGKVFPLRGVIPATSGSSQSTQVTIPLRHTAGTITLREFDERGNAGTAVNLPVTVPLEIGDPYTTSFGSPGGLSTGGQLQPIDADDAYVDYIFPSGFVFPFFGTGFTSVVISSNGSLYFDSPPTRDNGDADDVPSSPGALGGYGMIAGLWEDLDLRTSSRGDAGVYVTLPDQQNPNRIIFRWQGVPCNFNGTACAGGTPVNFEIELQRSGIIKSRYGNGNSNLFSTVGIGGGIQDGYVIVSNGSVTYTSEASPTSLTNAPEVIYTPRVLAPTPTPTPTPTPSPTPTPTPQPSPIELAMEESAPVPTLAAALDSMLLLRDPFPVINTSNLLRSATDPNTRVVIFVRYLQLLPGEQPSAVIVKLIDNNNQVYNIPAEDVRPRPTGNFSQVVFRLPSNLPVGTCSLSVIAHGMTTNSGTIRIRI